MNYRLHATATFSRRRIYETFISPSFYVAMSVGLLLGYFLVSGFVGAVDSSGLNFGLNPVYELLTRALSGAFGDTFILQLFVEGPFLFALHAASLPFLLYLSVSAVYRFGFERSIGAVELLTYGPADGTSCFLSLLIRNILFSLLYLVVQLVFFLILSLLNNLALGPHFFYSLLLFFFLTISVFSYSTFASVLIDNSSGGVAFFVGLMVLFGLLQMGSFTIISGYVKNLSSVFAGLIQWISPLYYWAQGLTAADHGNTTGLLLSLFLNIALSAIVLLVSHFTIKARGIQA